MATSRLRISAVLTPEAHRACQAEAFRLFKEKGGIVPNVSDGLRSLLAGLGAGVIETHRCVKCKGINGAPWCFNCGIEIPLPDPR